MALKFKKQLFVEEYVKHPELAAAEVARLCGFSAKYAKQRAYELMRSPEVKAAIEHKQKLLLEKACEGQGVTEEAVIRDILETRERCIACGDGAWQVQLRLKCDEMLGKYLGMWQEKVEVSFADELAAALRKARAHVATVTTESSGEQPKPLLLEGKRDGEE